MLHALALDLKDDADLIERYEAHHRAVWPEVLSHLARHGVLDMKIFRLGTRMVMLMETDDSLYDAERMAQATRDDPVVRDWETLMWTFQAATPWTAADEKWTPMHCLFEHRFWTP